MTKIKSSTPTEDAVLFFVDYGIWIVTLRLVPTCNGRAIQ